MSLSVHRIGWRIRYQTHILLCPLQYRPASYTIPYSELSSCKALGQDVHTSYGPVELAGGKYRDGDVGSTAWAPHRASRDIVQAVCVIFHTFVLLFCAWPCEKSMIRNLYSYRFSIDLIYDNIRVAFIHSLFFICLYCSIKQLCSFKSYKISLSYIFTGFDGFIIGHGINL